MPFRHFQGIIGASPVLVLLVILHLWPLSLNPGHLSLHGNADTMVSEWLISWPAHALVTGNAHLFDANIFWPEPQTLTFGDPVLVPAIFAAPILWLGGSPVLAFNLVTALGLLATALSCWLVARRWIGGSAALLAGALGAFNVHLLTRLPHLPASHLWGVPLALLAADVVADAPTPRRVGGLALVIAASAATSMYTLTLVCVVVCVVGITRITRGRGDDLGSTRKRGDSADDHDGARRRTTGWNGWVKAVGGLGLATVLGLLLALPVLLPYARFAGAGHERPLVVVAQFSATPAAYLSTQAWLHRGWSSAFFTTEVNALFPGALAVLLASVGLVHLARGSSRDRRRALTLVTLLVVGIVLSLGTHTALYETLHRWIAPVRGIRVPARFGYLALVAIAVAAAAGLQAVIAMVRARSHRPRLEAYLVAAAVVLATMEAWQGPVAAVPFTRLPRIYMQLPRPPAPVRLVEVPFYPADAVHENAEYVLNSTLHWRPLLNGYSGFTPLSYRRRTETIWYFPDRRAIDTIAAEGATHVMVHLARFGADRDKVERLLATEARLELLAVDPAGRRLYKVRE